MSILVLGIGNLIMSDDGVGVRTVQRLMAEYSFPPEVTVLDGGTLGLDLLPKLEGVDKLLVVDAVETGKAPGTVVRLSGDEVPIVLETKVSPHQMGLKDLLAVAMLQGFAPQEMVLLGVQPEVIEMGLVLTPAVAGQVGSLVEKVLAELVSWGVLASAVAEKAAPSAKSLQFPLLEDLDHSEFAVISSPADHLATTDAADRLSQKRGCL